MHAHPELVPSAEVIVEEFLIQKPRRLSHQWTSRKWELTSWKGDDSVPIPHPSGLTRDRPFTVPVGWPGVRGAGTTTVRWLAGPAGGQGHHLARLSRSDARWCGMGACGPSGAPGSIFPNSVTRVVPGLSGRSCQPIRDETPSVTSLLAQQHGARQAIAAVGVMMRWLTLAPAGVWANLEPAGGLISAPPWDLENYGTHREAVNGVR